MRQVRLLSEFESTRDCHSDSIQKAVWVQPTSQNSIMLRISFHCY